MTDQDKKLKVEFAPGCFDDFDGTQQELDELVAEIHRLVETGEIFENSVDLDIEDLEDARQQLLDQDVQPRPRTRQ
jgi:hypothetical protein